MTTSAMLVRPAAEADIAALVTLAAGATAGVHTLPKTRAAIERSVERSIASFAADVDMPADESYTFVLEDSRSGALLGTAALAATAGTNGTFFAFRNDVMQQVSRDLNISHSVHALTLCSGLTGHSQLSSFYVANADPASAALLSRARLMFAAVAPHRFGDRFFASLAGVTDQAGHSPFWEALGRKFFQIDFLEAERLIDGGRNRSLIIELMPHYPVYVPLLPGDAQAAMGQVHVEGELPLQILTDEGFEADEFIDIFDGGPILQAHKHALRAFTGSRQRRVMGSGGSAETATYLVSNIHQQQFRAVLCAAPAIDTSDSIALSAEARRSLQVAPGDTVHCVKL
ncbi:arginine N-succinyltransferase [Actimicrobium sp. CCC2.4]|uniref:arginine N-succinyltransferase n=1 Tax=Actimicrobium sp. CCC2.4 TaxID=3048606 RepID=UPI002AC9CD04|nr:arginine N-succinyltransferase [Actimicrobium sp. CCC2.4]MEB0136868.1 arginine N-succinyltransferase [Actimicrobium sp. CCC2.4]WPX33419.1 arginine N-succinyltransferase [Actimicrobium sp. CCC2.4]